MKMIVKRRREQARRRRAAQARTRTRVFAPRMPRYAETILAFNPVSFRAADYGADYNVEFQITAEALDHRGFVTDNHFILQYLSVWDAMRVKSRDEIIATIISIAKAAVGHRLLRVDGKVLRHFNAHKFNFDTGRVQPMRRITPTELLELVVVYNMPVQAKIVNTDICSGYDGSFYFSVEASAANGYIDKDTLAGFIKHAFQGKPLKASCEELSHGIIAAVLRRYPNALQVVARVINNSGYVQTLWTRGVSDPHFPRDATFMERVDAFFHPRTKELVAERRSYGC